MRPIRPERDHKNRWCFQCETWRDMEPWSTSWDGCRCPTCEYVAKVANPFFETLKCSACGRLCEGVSDEKGRLGCSYECAYKLGHIPRQWFLEYGWRKWKPARINHDSIATIPPVSSGDETTIDALLARARDKARDAYRRGAEAMREACVEETRRVFDVFQGYPPSLEVLHSLRALPIPEET